MTLDLIQTPTPSIKTVLTCLAEHARANPLDDVIMINRSVRADQWPKRGGHLAGHASWHGVEADLDSHAEFLRVQGWSHFEKDGASWWIVRSDMPRWITADYLLPRCLTCATNNWAECRCGDLTAAGKKKRYEYCYVLQLQTPNHFYVGRTIHPETRMERHIFAGDTAWTALHKPVRILALERVYRDRAQEIEDQTTLDLMSTFGAKVRGGYYISDDQVRKALPKVALVTRERGPSLAPADPSVWASPPAEGDAPPASLWSGLPSRRV